MFNNQFNIYLLLQQSIFDTFADDGKDDQYGCDENNVQAKKMLTNSELLKHLHNVLKTSDLHKVTAVTVRRTLEEQLDIDLSDKKTFIWNQIKLYLQSLL